jgi:hypothetical protein
MRPVARQLLVALLLIGAAAGCTAETPPPPTTSAGPTTPAAAEEGRIADPDLVTMRGLRGINIGATKQELVAAGLVNESGPCGPVFPSIPNASPVFDGDTLVLIWAHAPLRTPERISVGSTLDEARLAYPSAIELTRPPGATDYPGLLVSGETDRAILLLHDGTSVQKLIVGYESYARRLFDTRFGSC